MKNCKTIKQNKYVPLVEISGDARECGQHYAEFTLANYPGFHTYLHYAREDQMELSENHKLKHIYENRVPFLIDILAGMNEICKHLPQNSTPTEGEPDNCTSFAVSGVNTHEGKILAGQNKDTHYDKMDLYIVLKMKIQSGPTILTLAYPGELLGYGIWNNGSCIFRNDLKSVSGAKKGIGMRLWSLLAMGTCNIEETVKNTFDFGLRGQGHVLVCNTKDEAVSVEFNAGGIETSTFNTEAIMVHANHPVGEKTAKFEHYPDENERNNSRYRHEKLYELLRELNGAMTAENIFTCLSDHSAYPRGICRHLIGDSPDHGTTAAIVADPGKGKLHVTKGNPCKNAYKTYCCKSEM